MKSHSEYLFRKPARFSCTRCAVFIVQGVQCVLYKVFQVYYTRLAVFIVQGVQCVLYKVCLVYCTRHSVCMPYKLPTCLPASFVLYSKHCCVLINFLSFFLSVCIVEGVQCVLYNQLTSKI